MQSDIGTILVEGGVITEGQLQHALTTAVKYGGTLVQNLIRLEFVTDEDLASFLATKLKLPMAGKTQFDNLPAFITRLVPNEAVMTHRLIPIMLHQGVLHMAMADPTDRAALEEIAFVTGYRASPVIARLGLIEESMARYYGIPPEEGTLPPEAFQAPQMEAPAPEEEEPQETSPETPHPDDEASTAFSHSMDAIPIDVEEPVEASESGEFPGPAQSDAGEVVPTDSQAGLDQARGRLEVVEKAEDELEELFFGLGREDRGVVHLTRKKDGEPAKSGTITDAIRSQTGVEPPATSLRRESALENILMQARAEAAGKQTRREVDSSVAEYLDQGPVQPASLPSEESPPEPKWVPLADSEEARILIGEAADRDEVAQILVRFALSFMPRIVLFIIKRDILVGWMGCGEGIADKQVRGIMIPLNSPSVFRTVRETGTDYFGSLPKTTVNDIFISALGELRPRQVLLVPISVRHKPICIIYGDSGTSPGFLKDLSPVHLLIADVSQAFERMILKAKISSRSDK